MRDGMAAPTPVTVISSARLQDLAHPEYRQRVQHPALLPGDDRTATNNIQPREAGSIQADLRGLGPNRTLVLVDGHRFVPRPSSRP